MGCDFLVYAVALGRVFSHRCAQGREIIESVGLTDLFSLTLPQLQDLFPKGGRILEEICDDSILEWAQREILWAKGEGIQVIYIEDERYPARLRECPDAPIVIYFKGNCSLNPKRSLSIVGTRRASYYGRESCRKIVESLSKSQPKPLIVSGLAYGIDAAAHRAALEFSLPTVGVLATGLDTIYPSSHRELAKQLLQNGGLITDFPSGTTPIPNNFRRRNRIIAGMSDGTALMESFQKGGGLITTALAASYSREVFALPGRIFDESFSGCNKLIHNNIASIISSPSTIEESLNWASHQDKNGIQRRIVFPDDPQKKLVFKTILSLEPIGLEDISQRTAIHPSELSLLLLEMELSGELRSIQGNKYCIVR